MYICTMKITEVLFNQEIKLNKYPRKVEGCILLKFTGKQKYYDTRVPNTWALHIKQEDITIYHANAIGSYTAIDYADLPIPLLKEISKLI